MTAAMKTLVGLEQGSNRNLVEAVLPVGSSLELVGVVEGLVACRNALQQSDVDVVLLACAGHSDEALSFLEDVTRERPDRPVIVLHPGYMNGFVGRVFAAGAEDVVELPEAAGAGAAPAARERVSAEVSLALEKTLARRQHITRASTRTRGRMVTVLGPKGGAGKT